MMPTKELTTTLLKEKMTDAMVFRGWAENIDNLKTGGYYLINQDSTSATGIPIEGGTLEVYERLGGVLQRIVPYGPPNMILQRFYSSMADSWSLWYKFIGAVVTS